MRDIVTYINEGFKLGKNKVKKEDNDFVDLNLPSKTLWCKYNVGATCGSNAESWYGNYFTWGDTKPATNKRGNWGNYKWYNSDSNKLIKYCTSNKTNYWDGKGKPDNKLVLDEEDDMANANMGGNWKMPTKEELQELINNTTNEWVTDYNGISGLNGILFTSKSNDNTLFIPAAGFLSLSSINNAGYNFYIWSSTLNVSNPNNAYILNGGDIYKIYVTTDCRYYEFPVRAIMN